MPFLDTLRRVFQGEEHGQTLDQESRKRLVEAWSLEEPTTRGGLAATPNATPQTTAYDRAQWHKRLKRILEDLPASEHEWDDLLADGRALGFEPEWMDHCAREEFNLLIRRAVADRVFTEQEHDKLDHARRLIGIPESEAEALLQAIVTEAESFFGDRVEGV